MLQFQLGIALRPPSKNLTISKFFCIDKNAGMYSWESIRETLGDNVEISFGQ